MQMKPYKKLVSMTELVKQQLEELSLKLAMDGNATIAYLIRNASHATGLERFATTLNRLEDRAVDLRNSIESIELIQESVWKWIFILNAEEYDRIKKDPAEYSRRLRESVVLVQTAKAALRAEGKSDRGA